jgi:hypothetical protein
VPTETRRVTGTAVNSWHRTDTRQGWAWNTDIAAKLEDRRRGFQSHTFGRLGRRGYLRLVPLTSGRQLPEQGRTGQVDNTFEVQCHPRVLVGMSCTWS